MPTLGMDSNMYTPIPVQLKKSREKKKKIIDFKLWEMLTELVGKFKFKKYGWYCISYLLIDFLVGSKQLFRINEFVF